MQFPTRSIESPLSSSTLKNCAKAALGCQQHSVLRIDENLSPVSLDSVVIAESDHPGNGRYTGASPITSVGCLEANQVNDNSKVKFISLLGELTLSWTLFHLTTIVFSAYTRCSFSRAT